MYGIENQRWIDELEEYMKANVDTYAWDAEKERDMQYRFISGAFRFHYDNCDQYRNYCDQFGITPDAIQTFDDLDKIPQIPVSVFKKAEVISVPYGTITKKCSSSGTQGSKSMILRDAKTVEHIVEGLSGTLRGITGLSNAVVLNLGPSQEEASDLWFANIMNMIGEIFPSYNFIRSGVFYPDEVISAIERYRHKTIAIISAPIMVMRLIDYMKSTGIILHECESLYIITGGGWKKVSGQQITQKELTEAVRKQFQGLDEMHMRDSFNMTEINSLFSECAVKQKHMPPWVKVIIRDPYELKPLPNGETGILSFLDASAISYPAFIITTDLGRLTTGECACGRRSDRVEIIGRINKGQARGCALKIDKRYSGA